MKVYRAMFGIKDGEIVRHGPQDIELEGKPLEFIQSAFDDNKLALCYGVDAHPDIYNQILVFSTEEQRIIDVLQGSWILAILQEKVKEVKNVDQPNS